MAAQKTISIRLAVEDAVSFKQQLVDAGITGGAAFDKIREAAEKVARTDPSAVVAVMKRIAAAATEAQTAIAQTQANAFAGVTPAGGAEDYAARAADVEAFGNKLDGLRAKYSPLFAVSKQYEATLTEIGFAEKVGALSATEAAAARERATASFAAATAPLAAAGAATAQHAKTLDGVTVSSGAAAAATRNLSIQVIQGISGIATGQPVLTTLIQQGHQVADSSLAMGTGFKGLADSAKGLFNAVGGLPSLLGVTTVGALVALGAAADSEGRHLSDLRQQLRATHDDYAGLATAVDAAAKRVAASSTLATSDARAAAQTIASAKYFAGTTADIELLAKMSADLARVWNTDVAKASTVLKDAINDPAAAAKTFAEQGLPGFNASLAKTVESLQTSGQRGAAFQLVLTQLSGATKGAAEDQTPLQKALHDLEMQFSSTGASGKSFATELGEIINGQVAKFINDLQTMLRGIQNIRDLAGKAIPGQLVDANTGQTPKTSTDLARVAPDVTNKIYAIAEANGIPANIADLGTRVVYQESRGQQIDPKTGQTLTSPAGALGLGQLMPGTAAQYGVNPNNADENILGMLRYLVDLSKDPRFKTEADVAGAYNAGPTGYSRAKAAGTLPAETAKYIGAVTGVAPTAEQYGPPAPTGVSAGVVDNTRSTIDALDKQRESLNLLADARKKLINERAGFQAALNDPNAHLTTDQVTAYKAAIADLTGKLNDAISPADAFIRSMKDQAAGAAAETAGDKALIDVRQKIAEIERDNGNQFTAAQRAEAEGLAVSNLSASLRALEKDMGRQTSDQAALAAAYGQGNQAVLDTTAKQQAYQTLLQKFPQDSAAIAAALPELSKKYEDLARSQAVTATAQQNLASNDNLALIQAQTATLGLNDGVRNRLIATMKAEQEMHRKFGDVLPAEAEEYVRLAGATSDASTKLAAQQQTLSELTGAVSSAADAITNGVTQAFLQGQGAAVNWGNIIQGIESQVVGLIAKLLLVNPLLNALDGGSRSTISSVGGLLGNLLGNSGSTVDTTAVASGAAATNLLSKGGSVFDGAGVTPASETSSLGGAAASGGVSPLSAVGSAGTVAKGLDFLTGGSLSGGLSSGLGNSLQNLGYVSGQSVGAFVSNVLGESVSAEAIAAAKAADLAGNVGAGVGAGASAEAISGAASAAGEAGVGSIGAAANTVLAAAGYVAAAYTVISDIVKGNVRGLVLEAVGAAIGTAILPGVGTVIGIGLGSLVDSLLPNHPKNPYSNTEVDIQNGQIVAGKQVSQIETTQPVADAIATFNDQFQTYMTKVGIVITNGDTHLGDIGDGIKGLQQNANLGELFNRLHFGNVPGDTSNFGIAKSALGGMTFADPQALNTELIKIASFSDAMSALGIRLGQVGTDLTSIQIASVSLTGALDDASTASTDAASATAAATQAANDNADGSKPDQATAAAVSQLRIALAHDLPGQVFANVDALSAEIDKVNTFVNGTMQGLLHPVLVSTSAFIDALAANHKKYDDAIAEAVKYGLDIKPLSDAKDAADALLYYPQRVALDQANDTVTNNITLAGGADPTAKFYAQAGNDNITHDQQRDALIKSMTDVYGDAVKSTQFYFDRLTNLDSLYATQVAASVTAFQRQQTTNGLTIQAAYTSIQARQAVLNGNQEQADLLNYDAKAAQEKDAYGNQLADFYGESFRQSQDYQNRLSELETVQQGERLAIITKYGAEATAALTQAQGNVTSLFTSLTTYAQKLQTGSDSPLSATDQYALATRQFNAVAGAAAHGDYASASQITTYADSLLATSRAVNGSGAGYASDFSKVLDALSSVSAASDALTASAQKQIASDETKKLQASQADLNDKLIAEIGALRREIQQQTRTQQAAA